MWWSCGHPQPLPGETLAGRYAGIVVWPNSNSSGIPQKLHAWLRRQMRDGRADRLHRLLRFSRAAGNPCPFGLQSSPVKPVLSTGTVVYQDPMIGFELHPTPRQDIFTPITAKTPRSC